MLNTLILFTVASFINVIIQTLKTIFTVKGSKFTAAIINAVTFGFYTYFIVLIAMCDLSTLSKCLITAGVNFIGVYLVKYLEQRFSKTKLWKIEATFKINEDQFSNALGIYDELREECPCNYSRTGDTHYTFICYCETESQSLHVKNIIKKYNGKYFITENGGVL